MIPDSLESRIGRVELDMAGVKQRVDDLRVDVKELAPLVVSVAEIRGAMTRMQTDMQGLTGKLGELSQDLSEREEERQEAQREALKDSQSWRRALIVGSFTVLAALVTAASAVLVAVVG